MVKCPVPSCDHRVFCRDIDGLFLFLGSFGVKRHHALGEEWRFQRAFQHQIQLNTSWPNLTAKRSYLAEKLHSLLVGVGAMRPLDGDATYREAEVQLISIEEPGQPLLKLPFFLQWLRNPMIVKTCAICDEDYLEIDVSDEAVQKILSQGSDFFGGNWTRSLWFFPNRYTLPDCWARHALDTCWSCLRAYIATKVDDGNSDGITCPHVGCGNVFTHEQIKSLASNEAFEKYERLQLFRCLSGMGDFLWCLAENCGAGQIHDLSRSWAMDQERNSIRCHACGFRMCYGHQTPWHVGQSCEQYNRERGHDQETVDWVAKHTKPCPNCKAPVEKNSGCFHMTCRICNTEYCWLCMADWNRISSMKQYGHKEECVFRQTPVEPTEVNGATTEEAIAGIAGVMERGGPWRFL